ncbi:MAG: FHA domain-containing protein [Oligoflexia bacterium]|nr:FHA domain-containing protein [Oligoflexia bacterium]
MSRGSSGGKDLARLVDQVEASTEVPATPSQGFVDAHLLGRPHSATSNPNVTIRPDHIDGELQEEREFVRNVLRRAYRGKVGIAPQELPSIVSEISAAPSDTVSELHEVPITASDDDLRIDFGDAVTSAPVESPALRQNVPFARVIQEALWKLPLDQELVIGRDSEQADIVIEDPYVSGVHLIAKRIKQGLAFRDAGSRNGSFWCDPFAEGGTRLNRISGDRFMLLQEGIQIRLSTLPDAPTFYVPVID